MPSRRPFTSWPSLLGLSCLALVGACSGPPADIAEPWAGGVLVLELAPGEVRGLDLELQAGEYVEIEGEQVGVDVVLTLFDPESTPLAEIDSPVGSWGVEVLAAIAPSAGPHRLEVRAFEGQAGGELHLAPAVRRPAGAEERARLRGFELFTEGEALRRSGERRAAAEGYRQALDRFAAGDAPSFESEALLRLGKVHRELGEAAEAEEAYRRALPLLESSGRWHRSAIALDHIGRALLARGEVAAARTSFERALELRRLLGSREGEMITLNNLGLVCQRLGAIEEARGHHRQALEIARGVGDPFFEAEALRHLGNFHEALGSIDRAIDAFAEAEAIFERLGDGQGRAEALDRLGQLEADRGDDAKALELLERALALHREMGNEFGRAFSLANISWIHRQRGELGAAAEGYSEALEIFERLGEPRAGADVLRNLAAVAAAERRPGDARELLDRALQIHRRLGDPAAQAGVLRARAELARSQGELAPARAEIARALELVETLRTRTSSPALRTSYLAELEDFYDAQVDILMASHRRDGEAGWDEQAFEISERGRARTLLEELHSGPARGESGLSGERRGREKELRAELDAAAARRRDLLDDWRADEEVLRGLDRRLREFTSELDALQAEARRGDPRWAAGARPLDLDRVRREVLDSGSQLLAFDLGPERSYLFHLTREKLDTFELPPAAEIEALARRAHHFLERSHRRESAAAARRAFCELARALFEPLPGGLGDERLLVMAEGALWAVPFAALPEPGAKGGCEAAPMLERREVVLLPSASAIAALRRREREGRGMALLADPEFPEAGLPRLSFSRVEAGAILDAAPEGENLLALGGEASKELVVSGRLADYRVLHFATHGLLDTEHPELSALALSAASGPGEAFLYAHEIHELDLSSELVVLSACRTALGREARGEGILGLPRAFLSAGAKAVVVSLWKVDDRATAELMGHFYRAIFEDGERPAAALRRAQLEVRADPRFAAPYYWAAFTHQGEWR